MFQAYRDAGLCVIPQKGGIPQVEWRRYFAKFPAATDIADWEGRYNEYGLVCGEISNITAVDIDTDDSALIALLAGDTPVKKRGSKGFTAFYQWNGEASRTWTPPGADRPICELLSDKRLTTIPPSPHRKTGKPYVWIGHELPNAELPTLNPTFVAMMDVQYPRPSYAPRVTIPRHAEPVEIMDTEKMLSFISPDCSREEWVEIGMALRDEYGDAACGLWHRWSAKSVKYDERAANYSWRSFNGTGHTIGTLIWRAQQGGWKSERYKSCHVENKPKLKRPSTKSITSLPPPITNIVTEIADWITATAIRPQPVLSLSAALTFMGMVKGRRIRGATNLRTNILSLSLAPTSAGKEHPQFCVDQLAEACGMSRHLMGRPTSGPGLLTGLDKAGGLSLLTIDEFGRYLGNITLKTSGGFQREIADYMVELFSKANRTFRGRQQAKEKDNPQIILYQPHLCCLGSTVPERLAAACTSAEVIDGFLNRWLVFYTKDRPDKRRNIKFAPPPVTIIQRIGEWLEANPLKTDSYGNPEPKEVRFTPEAWDMLVAFDELMIKRLDSEPFPINQLYARSAEHVEKVAMVLCDEDVIGTPELKAAVAIIEQSNLHIAVFAGNISNTQHESDVIYLLDTIKEQLTISRNDLTKKTRRLTNRARTDILNQLIESGEINYDNERKEFSIAPS